MGLFNRNKEGDVEAQKMEMLKTQQNIQQGDAIDEAFFHAKQKEREDLLKWQQDVLDEFEGLKNKLRGLTFDARKGWIRNEHTDRLMNEKGVSMIDLCCSSLLTRNLINSNLSEKIIMKRLLKTMNAITINLGNKGLSEYNIDFANFDMIIDMVVNTTIPTLFRALNGWNKQQDNSMSKRVEAYADTGNQGKKSLWGL